MAVDALEYEDEEANRYVAVEEILGTPERLKIRRVELDLDASAVELGRPRFDVSVTLYDFRIQFRVRLQ
jgi:hypothetical protein